MPQKKKYVENSWVNPLWMNLNRTIQTLRSEFNREAKEMGIQILPEQWVILYSLFRKNGLTQIEIASSNYKHTPSISRTINNLVDKGLVYRESQVNDRRKVKVFLTDRGRELVENLYPKVLQVREKSWKGLTKEDFDQFLRILNKMQNNLAS